MMPTESPDKSQEPIFQRLDRCASYPYPRSVYVRRLLWLLVQSTFIRWSLPRAYRWRRFWLRLFGANMGDTAATRPRTWIIHPWLLTMAQRSMLSDDVKIYNLGPVTIGQHTVLSQDVYVCAGTHDYTQPHLPLQRPPITIGSGVWVCAGAFIGPDVTIGDNSVVGARAVVTKDVPAGVVVGGNPATVIKKRSMTPE